jgi:hypothetical protein
MNDIAAGVYIKITEGEAAVRAQLCGCFFVLVLTIGLMSSLRTFIVFSSRFGTGPVGRQLPMAPRYFSK